MLSLPTIPPRADASLWPSLRTTHAPNHDDTPPSPTNPHHAHQRRPSHHNHSHPHNTTYTISSRSLLAQLASEENKISQRKQNISRYGSTWIRPPGVPKTFQAIEDEKAEREEQEAIARREQVMMDLAAAQQEAANAEEREEGHDMEDEEGERDLDDEVPEAEEADSSDMSASEEESENEVDSDEEEVEAEGETQEGDTTHHTTTADVTFNEDSFIEGSMLEDQVSHMLAMEEASMAGTLQEERDLDDDIPEAGSYEHTDSSLIDSSSEGEGPSNSSFQAPPPVRRRRSERRDARRSSGRRSSGMGMGSGVRQRSGATTNTRSGGTINTRSGGASNIRSGGSVMNAPPPRMQMLGMDMGMETGSLNQPQSSRLSLEFDGSSSMLELDGSSFLRSSPAAARGNDLRSRFMGARGGR